jgi:4-hydroxy-2-oxoheptanedioate aldolase
MEPTDGFRQEDRVMMKSLLVLLTVSVAGAQPAPAQSDGGSTPARVNRVIELLERGQPVYYTSTTTATYEEGMRLARTPSDYINFEMEHGAFNVAGLREFMSGLVDGGPTASGHRTPPVIVSLPVLGLDEASMRANYWVIQQVLAAGVHGILLCHARDPEAARVMIEAARYPFAPEVDGLDQGFRGSGSQGFASRIWGLPQNEYLRRADPWPMNPEGELFFGVKIEDSYALENAELTTKIPGIAFAEWGPGDMGFWLLGAPRPGLNAQQQPQMIAARARVFQATRDAHIFFLNTCNENNVVDMIEEGVMICTGGFNAGRAHTNRQMPWQ